MALLGRDDELRVLAELVGRMPERGGALVLLGEPGIGKSSLLRDVVSPATGLVVLETVGVQAETRLPFAGLHHLLRPVLSAADVLPATQRRALETAFGADEGPPPEPFMIALAVLNLLADVASRQPVLVVIDDVQWLDQPTQEVLAFVARRVDGDPIVFIGAVRTGHPGPFVAAGLPELQVRGLDVRSAGDLLAKVAGDLGHGTRDQILREAQGNPLALVELPVAWRADPSASSLPLTARLERAFAGRIAELPSDARDAVLVAAVDSADELPEILAAASVLSGQSPTTSDVLDDAASAGLLRFDETRVNFRHPLVRSAALRSETAGRRQAAHAALGVVLTDPYRRTWHRAHSIVGPDDEIADALAANHKYCLRRGSVAMAIQALERSAQLTTDSAKRGGRYLQAAEYAFGLGRADTVDRLLDAANHNSLSTLDRARMEWLREIFNDGVPGNAPRVFELCGIAQQADDTDLALNLLLGAGMRCFWTDPGPAARARVVEVTRAIGVPHDPRYVTALAAASPVREGAAVTEILSRVSIETVTDPEALRLLGMAAHAIGDPVRGIDFLDRAEHRLRKTGQLGLLSHVITMQVLDRIEVGDWERAAIAVEEARHLGVDTAQPRWDNASLALGAIVAGLRGDNDTAQSEAARAEYAAHTGNSATHLACVQLARGFGWMSTGHYSEAYGALRRLFDPSEPSFHPTERFHGVMFLAETAVHIGRQAEARNVVAELEPVAKTTPAPTLHMHLSYARAVLADDQDAEKLFVAALRRDLVRWPWVKARLELAYGSWLRRQRRVAESREPLRSAQTVLELIGATTWAEAARAELRATGERTVSQSAQVHETLSGQELQIARLAAEGMSNREIGERLYLSHRTVASHLYRAFPKLNVTSRSQLAARIGGGVT
jgi:DNA-binding CsgD family transcriptional regulator